MLITKQGCGKERSSVHVQVKIDSKKKAKLTNPTHKPKYRKM